MRACVFAVGNPVQIKWLNIIGFGKPQVIYPEIRAGYRVVHLNTRFTALHRVEGISHLIICSQKSSSFPCLQQYRGQLVRCG